MGQRRTCSQVPPLQLARVSHWERVPPLNPSLACPAMRLPRPKGTENVGPQPSLKELKTQRATGAASPSQ
jgi:hypothetical protein